MDKPRIAVVCSDPRIRLQAARAFDSAPLEWLVALFDEPPEDADVVVRTSRPPGRGILLDLEHPDRTIAQITQELQGRAGGMVIEVASTGGGTGATSVALHLAAYLSEERPALYIESHRFCGAAFRLGLDEPGPAWIAGSDVIPTATLPVAGGLRVLFAPDTDASIAPETVDACRGDFRFVVVDRGPRVSECEALAKRVLVMPPTVPSARRAARILQDNVADGWIVLSNRLGPGSEVTDAVIASVVGRSCSVELPCSPSLRDAEDSGRLLRAHASGWSRRIARLARALNEVPA